MGHRAAEDSGPYEGLTGRETVGADVLIGPALDLPVARELAPPPAKEKDCFSSRDLL